MAALQTRRPRHAVTIVASIMGSRRPGGSVLKRRERLPDAPLRTGPSLVAISVDRVNFHKKPNRLALVGQLLV